MLKKLLSVVAAALPIQAGAFTYQDDTVAFELPGKWIAEADPATLVTLFNEKRDAQFIVSVVKVTTPMDSYESKLQRIEQIAGLRKQAISQLSRGTARVGDPSIAQVGESLVYDFIGMSTDPAVRMYIRLIQRRDKIASFSLYEFGGRTQEQFVELVREAFKATRIK